MKPIVSKNIRVRCPKKFIIGDNSIVDDYGYFSTQVSVGKFSHIASQVTVGGGKERLFKMGNYSSVSSGVRIWCVSDDFSRDIVTIFPAHYPKIKEHTHIGDVTMDDFTAIGANSVVMPDNHIPIGTVIGALSYVPPAFKFKPWSVYAGVPIRFVKRRNKMEIDKQIKRLKKIGKNG